jgi:YHS domain-containing protein
VIFSLNQFAQDKKIEIQKKVESEKVKLVDDKQELKKSEMKLESNKPVNTVCPVSGEEIENGAPTTVYNGKTYALCCKSCLKKFNKDPEKYLSKLSEDGKSFKKKTN